MDLATKENLERLVEIGTKLLEKPVSRVNLETGRFENVEADGTNAEALTRFAKLLSEERKFRAIVANDLELKKTLKPNSLYNLFHE